MSLGLFTLFACLAVVTGHGYLETPAARNSMWRAGFDTPENFDDMGLNCGGAATQWETFGGKCGICGDPYDANPGDHVVGGIYVSADRPLSRCYNRAENVIAVKLRITAYHRGYFEFRLCENNNMAVDPTIDCFENGHLLTIAGTSGETRYSIQDVKEPSYEYELNMPIGVTCTQCILRWTYNAGNSNGCDETGCGIGLGKQEQFINCADIAILEDCSGGTGVTDAPTDAPTGAPTDEPTDAPTDAPTDEPTDDPTDAPTGGTSPYYTSTPPTDWGTTDSQTSSPYTQCWGVGMFAGASGDSWCMTNCFHTPSYCPEDYCACGYDDDGPDDDEADD